MPQAVLSVGSNLGDRHANISVALSKLENIGRIAALSDIYETPPLGYAEQGDFLNAAVALETSLAPEDLLDSLMRIEGELGRVRKIANGPRTIDLDIIFYENVAIKSEKLELPHPRWTERDFVITPMLDILDKGVFDSPEYADLKKFLGTKKRKFESWRKI